MELRPYQVDAVRELLARLKARRRVVAVSPTGSGKTTIAVAVVARTRGRILWLAHRVELLKQARAEFARAGVNTDRITFASALKAPQGAFALVVVDEAHRIAARTYQEAIGDNRVLGLTATPERLDGQPLADTFADMYVVAESVQLIADGYIAKPVCYGLSKRAAREIVNGLKSEREASRRMRSRVLMGDTIKECMRLAPKERTIVFAVDRAHAQDLTRRFLLEGIATEYLDGDTDSEARDGMVGKGGRLECGETQVVVNVDVLSEGIDLPSVKCIALCRPTKSLTRYMQQVGRGSRVYKGKRPIILDHAGNIWRHGFPETPRAWTLEGRDADAGQGVGLMWCCECGCMNAIEESECTECGAARPPNDREIEEHEAELERLRESERDRSKIERTLQKVAAARQFAGDWVERAKKVAS